MLKVKDLKNGFLNFWQDRKEPFEIPKSEIQKFVVGESFRKVPIYCYKVGHGERKILFVSAIHGNEIGTVKLAHRLLDHLISNEKKFKKLTCFVIPCLNVDGFKDARRLKGYFKNGEGRLNANSVDLNRNFPTANFRNRSYALPKVNGPTSPKYRREISMDEVEAESFAISKDVITKNCGEFGGSELETKALTDLVEKEKISVIFSFHNTGQDVTGGKDDLSGELARVYANRSGYGILEESEWQKIGQTGTAKDWCDDQSISFVEVEGSTRYGSDWEIQKPALEAVLKYLAGRI